MADENNRAHQIIDQLQKLYIERQYLCNKLKSPDLSDIRRQITVNAIQRVDALIANNWDELVALTGIFSINRAA